MPSKPENEVYIRADIDGIDGINPGDILSIDEIIKEEGVDIYAEDTVEAQLKVLKEILDASDAEVKDYKWMFERVIRYGIFPFTENWYDVADEVNWNYYGLQQIPEEFTDFCIALGEIFMISMHMNMI